MTKEVHCAYCGKLALEHDREHVFPRCLYPPSKVGSRMQRLTVPACRECNASWADDEAHFRNVLVLAGEKPNAARQELWNSRIVPSFDESDGKRRLRDIMTGLKSVKMDDGEGLMIFPGKDTKVMRVVKKVIRGLSHYHRMSSPVSDKRVWVDVLKYAIPQELLEQTPLYHRECDIVEYRYEVMNRDGVESAWLITFFQRVSFVGLVSMSEDGSVQVDDK